MKTRIVDFTGVKTVWDFHERFIEPLGLRGNECGMIDGYIYARNFDALWDLLYPEFAEPTTVILKGLDSLPKEFDDDVRITKEIFNDLKKTDENLTVEYEE